MKRKSMVAALICSMCLTAAGSAVPVMADSAKVVTLGADLTQDQKNTMMNYFKADASQVQIITVTNADEREYLGNYISSEQIGTRTLSCAYVKPTQSGGIKVRTANLNYVTCNMIASALSTAGVTNCEAVAACPYEVSGTGALTGVMMAYETASGQQLDSGKKDLATKEVVVTGDAGEQIGQNNAADIINQAKMQIINGNIQSADEITNYVNNYAAENNITLDSSLLDAIVSLLEEYQMQNEAAIADQNAEIEEMKQTLESIQESLDSSLNGEEADSTDTEASADGDDITQDVDTSALGGDVKETSTEDAALAEETGVNTNEPTEESSDSTGSDIPEAEGDGTWDNSTDDGTETAADESSYDSEENAESSDASSDGEIPEATDDGSYEETDGTDTSADGTDTSADETIAYEDETDTSADETEASGDTLNTDSLTDEAKAKYSQAEQFCRGEYEGDTATLQAVMPSSDTLEFTGTLDSTEAASLSKKVEEAYIKVLQDSGASYVADGTEVYVSAELNMMNSELKTIFSIDTEPAADDLLVNEAAETRQALYDDTLKFFANLYGEGTSDETSADDTAEAAEETYAEEDSEEAY